MASIVTRSVLVLCMFFVAQGKVYDRCEFARELRDLHEIPIKQIPTWVCLARHESEFNTSALNPGSGDHGILQISELFWCSPPGYACGVSCEDLRNDDLEDDIICARRIYREHQRLSGDGFNAWVVYSQYCKDANYVQELMEGCFDGKTVEKPITDKLPEPVYFPQFTKAKPPVETTRSFKTTTLTPTLPPVETTESFKGFSGTTLKDKNQLKSTKWLRVQSSKTPTLHTKLRPQSKTTLFSTPVTTRYQKTNNDFATNQKLHYNDNKKGTTLSTTDYSYTIRKTGFSFVRNAYT